MSTRKGTQETILIAISWVMIGTVTLEELRCSRRWSLRCWAGGSTLDLLERDFCRLVLGSASLWLDPPRRWAGTWWEMKMRCDSKEKVNSICNRCERDVANEGQEVG